MGMDIYNTGAPFNPDPKYINFNSEIAIRKGNEGWVINSKVDNYSTSSWAARIEYILTTYKYDNNKWEKDEDPKWWIDTGIQGDNPSPHSITNDKGESIYLVNSYTKKLVIKNPVKSWWNGANWISPTGNSKIKEKSLSETKKWSGVWIDDYEKQDSWIFKDIELYIEDKKYSQVFCKPEGEQLCFEMNAHDNSSKPKKTNSHGSESWKALWDSTPTNEATKTGDMLKSIVGPIIEKLKNLKGRWMDMEQVCGLKAEEVPDEEKQNQLRMYCANGKKPE